MSTTSKAISMFHPPRETPRLPGDSLHVIAVVHVGLLYVDPRTVLWYS